jgi:isohexenylglutaconyl-CoA hydratase
MTELPATEQIATKVSAGWLTIRLNRPQARNALTAEMIEELHDVLETVAPDRSVRGITVRGNGGVFCAGGDIKEFKAVFQGEAGDAAAVAAANGRMGELLDRINRMPQVVLMMVEGAAMGGGLGLVCAADVVVVTRTAKFALTETTLGIPPAQIAPFVRQRLGLTAARRLMLTAERFDGAGALAVGLADRVVEEAADLDAAESDFRDKVLRCAPGANAATKEIMLAADRLDRDSMVRFAGDKFAACMLGPEGREGVAAFVEKRGPSWARGAAGEN